MIKAVLYDLGDVLFEAHHWRKWNYDEVVALKKFDKSFAEFYDLYETFLEPVYKGETAYNLGFENFLKHLKIADIDSFSKKSFEKKKFFEDTRILFPEVKETLISLDNSGIKNVIITDNEAGEAEIRYSVINKFEINDFISRIVSSKEVGYKKPAPQIFNHALQLLGLSVHEVLFVAHDEDEINGALALNIRTVEFNNYLNRPVNSTYSISTFSQLITLVNQLNNNNA